MNDVQQELVRASFARVAPISDQAAALFYGRLFAIDPGLRPLFKSDLTEQGRKLMAVLAVAVANLHRLDAILPTVQDLGRRHVRYGVKPADYDTVAAALLWTLEQALGADFTPATNAAWTVCYLTLAEQMKLAAESPDASAT
jgi:hemoglobin-like flavoprotein